MPASTIALRVEGDNAEVVRHREDLARKVLDYFDQHSILPDWRVICLLDDTDFQELKLRAGEANRGIHLCLENAALPRSEEHTSELQSLRHLVCRLLLEK